MPRTVSFVCALTLLASLSHLSVAEPPGPARWSSPPTDAQVISLMRELAHRDGSPEAHLTTGRHALEFDPEGALEHLRAAAAKTMSLRHPRLWTTGTLADAMIEAGAEDEALALAQHELLAGLARVESSEARLDYTSAEYPVAMAEYLWSAEPQLVRRVADEIGARLEDADEGPRGDHARRRMEALWLRMLALLEPERAWELALAGKAENWRPPPELVRNIGRGGPSNPAEILDEVIRRGVENSTSSQAREGFSLLAAALLRTAPEEAVARLAARQWGDSHIPEFYGRLLAPVAVDAGIDRLPRQSEYDDFYAGFTGAIARIDPDAAVALKDRIAAPELQARALGTMAVALADDDTDRARELVLEIVRMWRWTPAAYSDALVWAGYSLAEHGGDTMGIIIGTILGHQTAAPIWWRWRTHHPDEADLWIAGREEDERHALIAHSLVHAARDGEEEVLLELADQALASPEPTPRVITMVVSALADVAPDRAREAWGRLEERPVSGWTLHQHLEALTDLAYAFHFHEARSAAPEIAEMERLLREADPDDKWMLLLRGRLALLYAATDPPRAEAMARPLLEILAWDLRQRHWGRNVTPAAAHAVAALMIVDPESAQAALEHHPAITEEREFMRELIVELAVLDPEAAAGLLPVHSRTGHTDFSTMRFRNRVVSVAGPEVVRRFAEQWLASAAEATRKDALELAGKTSDEALEEAYSADGFRGLVRALETMESEAATARREAEIEHARTIGRIVNHLLVAEREDLMPTVIELLEEVTGRVGGAQLLSTLSEKSLECLPDATLERLMLILFSRGEDARDTRPRQKLAAEMASRDWRIGLALLDELPPLLQIQALTKVRTVPAQAVEATGPAAGSRN